jgi:hypothetical protein
MQPKRFILTVVSLLAALALVQAAGASAAGERLYLSPGSRTVAQGATFTVAIRVGAGAGVNAAQADLAYPADLLDYVSASYGGSAFSVQAASSGGGGSVHLARGSLSTLTGDQLLATLTFRAKVAAGSANIAFVGGSGLASDGADVPSSKAGASISFRPPATPAPTPVVTPAPPKDTTPPAISNIGTKDVTPIALTVTWQTDEASSSVVEYGLDTAYGLSASGNEAVTKHAIKLESSFVLPLLTYHFRIKSTDAAGNTVTSPDQTITTPGVPVQLTFKDKQGRPLAGAQVEIGGVKTIANSQGQVTIQTGFGVTSATITYGGKTFNQSLNISRADAAKPTARVLVLGASSAANPLWFWIVVGAVLAAAFAVVFVFRDRLKGFSRVTSTTSLLIPWHHR